jgi:sterol desaturase/sphingolipid hydroxylase (fatty acid hydroxylase superfamily)
MSYAFGPGAQPFTLFNGNVLLMAFLATYGHLRHSHMWIAFTGPAGRILQSPAHHQIHHSDHPAHWDKNLGFALAVWDWAFGTLHIPARDREVSECGVSERKEDFSTVGRSLARPFSRASESLTGEAAAPLTGEG